MPETRDRTLEEIHEMFEAKVPARKFKKYICTGTEAMAKAALKKGAIHVEEAPQGVKEGEGRASKSD